MPHALDGAATNVQPLVEYWGVLYYEIEVLLVSVSTLSSHNRTLADELDVDYIDEFKCK